MFKKLILLGLLLAPVMAHADGVGTVQRSSFTLTNDSAAIVGAGYLDKIVVGVAQAGGFLTVYNSSRIADPTFVISSISLSTVYEYDYGNMPVKGIFYTTASNTKGVQILWKK